VAQHLLSYFGVHALREHESGARMSQVMEAYVRKPRVLQELFKGPIMDVGRVEGRAYPRGEDETLISVERSCPWLLLCLLLTMAFQGCYGSISEGSSS
jgi:hypothetical protein